MAASIAPTEVKKQANQKQIILLAVLGVVLVLVFVVMVLPSLTGGSDSGSSTPLPTAPPVSAADAGVAPALGGTVTGSAASASPSGETTETTVPPPRPARTPFDPPR